MSRMCESGLARVNVFQTSLAIHSGATIHFFSNEDLLQSVKVTKAMKIDCGGSRFDHIIVGRIHNKLRNPTSP